MKGFYMDNDMKNIDSLTDAAAADRVMADDGAPKPENAVPVKGYLNEDFRMFHNTDTLGTDVGVHFHTFYKVTFVKYGKGSYMIDGRLYDIEPCDIILVGMNVPHQPSFEAGELYDRYTLYISEGLLERFDMQGFHICDLFSSERGNVIRPEGKDTEHFVNMMDRIEKETRSSSYASSLAARIGVIAFLIEAGRCREDSSLTVPLHLPEDDKMLNILRYLNDNLGNDISTGNIADHFSLGAEELKQSFKDAFGCPLQDYITNRRLTRAKEMILKGTGPAEACYACGYKSYQDFTNEYRNKYGAPPKKATDETPANGPLSDFLPE